MSHFYGTVCGQARTDASRRGSKNGGLQTTAASWSGAVKVSLSYDEKAECNRYYVEQIQWQNGGGINQMIDEGVVGQPSRTQQNSRMFEKILNSKMVVTLVGIDPELDAVIDAKLREEKNG